jgi:hypothetical protein
LQGSHGLFLHLRAGFDRLIPSSLASTFILCCTCRVCTNFPKQQTLEHGRTIAAVYPEGDNHED